MPTLHPDCEIGGVHGDSDAAMRGRAVYAAGFSGATARRLILRGDTTAQFDAALAEARGIRSIINIATPEMRFTGVDPATVIEYAIRHEVPLVTVREDMINAMAEHDMETHIDTSRRCMPSATVAQTAGVYAQRSAQIDELKGKNG